MAERIWTTAQKAKQSALIHNWQPWQHSAGPRTSSGKAIVSRNAYRGGIRPFLRLVSLACRVFGKPETLTIAIVDSIEKRMIDLCSESFRWRDSQSTEKQKSWLTQGRKKYG
jgi:hypothetical protein